VGQRLRFIYTPGNDGCFEFEICTEADEKVTSQDVSMIRESILGLFITFRHLHMTSGLEPGGAGDIEQAFKDLLKEEEDKS